MGLRISAGKCCGSYSIVTLPEQSTGISEGKHIYEKRCGKMKIKRVLSIRVACWLLTSGSVLILGACAGEQNTGTEEPLYETEEIKEETTEADSTPPEQELKAETEEVQPDISQQPEMIEMDWSEYFDGLNGAAVLYDPAVSQYMLYDPELAETRRSPCSTFKIISSMIALESGIMEPEDSMRTWSGEVFWNENWNHDIAFQEAFRVSCVWYFRELIDEIGPERMQAGLDQLAYGNRDISDWEGRLNTNNNNRALTGFWIESSLAISPKEQTEMFISVFIWDARMSGMCPVRRQGK